MNIFPRLVPIFCLAFAAGVSPLFAQVRIADYKDDKAAAFSFTFDDGFRHQVNNTLEIIEPLGFKGTFFLIPAAMEGPNPRASTINWTEAKALLEKGHELGTHGYVGQKLHEVDAATLDELVNGGWKLIKERTGVTPVSYARPGGSEYTEPVVAKVKEHHYFIRDNKQLPKGRGLRYGNFDRRKWDEEKMRERIRESMEKGEWMVPTVHAIVAGYAAFDSKEQFRTHCEWLKSQEDKLWIAPLGTVGRYVWQRDHSTVKVLNQNENALRFEIETTLGNPGVFNSELTVVVPAENFSAARAVDGNGGVLKTIIRKDAVLVTVPVDAGQVTVEWR